MAAVIRNTVRAAQMLQAFGGETGNPIEALFSFLEPILADFSGEEFDERKFAIAVREAYGWDFTEDVADGFRRSFKNRGWLKQKRSQPSNFPVFIDGKPVEVVSYRVEDTRDIAPDQMIDDALNEIIQEFRSFLDMIEVRRDLISFSDDDFVNDLVEWLLNNSSGSSIISDYMDSDDDEDDDQIKYLIARFVDHVNKNNAKLSTDLRNIAAVGLISELAQDFHKPMARVKKCRLEVFLDSPVALDLLGASGEESAQLSRSIIAKLQAIGANVSIFNSTVREMQSILDALLFADPADRFGPSQDAIRRGEIDIGFISSIRNDPAKAFSSLNVKVKNFAFEKSLRPDQYFSEADFGGLYSKLLDTQLNQSDKEKRCRHDALAAAWIMRLRKGHEHPDVFEATHIFLTRNRLFASLSREYCKQLDRLDEGCVGPMVNMHDLAASLWLRTGLHNEVDIPKRQLLVGCQRVLALKKPVVARAQKTILSLRDSARFSEERIRQIEAILSQDRSLALIADRVRGTKEKLEDDDLLRIAQTVMAEEESKGFRKGRAAAAAERIEDQRKLDEVQTANLKLQDEKKALEQAILEQKKRRKQRLHGVICKFNSQYTKSRKRMRVALVALAIMACLLAFMKEVFAIFGSDLSQEYLGASWRQLLLIFAAIPLLATMLDQIFRLTGLEQPIDRYIVNPLAKRKLNSMLSSAGFDWSDAVASAIPPQVPIERSNSESVRD